MDSVLNNVSVSHKAANVGVLTPPDHIARYRLTDTELESKYREASKDVFSKQKNVSFDKKRKTPVLAKIIMLCLGVFILFTGGRAIIRARR